MDTLYIAINGLTIVVLWKLFDVLKHYQCIILTQTRQLPKEQSSINKKKKIYTCRTFFIDRKIIFRTKDNKNTTPSK